MCAKILLWLGIFLKLKTKIPTNYWLEIANINEIVCSFMNGSTGRKKN
jgi:hypothetical protein